MRQRPAPPRTAAPPPDSGFSKASLPGSSELSDVVRHRPPILPERCPHRCAGGRCPGVCQSPRHSASRHQAVESLAGQLRQCLGGRLRAGQDCGGRRPDAHRRHPGDDPLHAAERFSGRCDARVGRVQPGIDALRAPGVAAGVRRARTGTADRAGTDAEPQRLQQDRRRFHGTWRRSSPRRARAGGTVRDGGSIGG